MSSTQVLVRSSRDNAGYSDNCLELGFVPAITVFLVLSRLKISSIIFTSVLFELVIQWKGYFKRLGFYLT